MIFSFMLEVDIRGLKYHFPLTRENPNEFYINFLRIPQYVACKNFRIQSELLLMQSSAGQLRAILSSTISPLVSITLKLFLAFAEKSKLMTVINGKARHYNDQLSLIAIIVAELQDSSEFGVLRFWVSKPSESAYIIRKFRVTMVSNECKYGVRRFCYESTPDKFLTSIYFPDIDSKPPTPLTKSLFGGLLVSFQRYLKQFFCLLRFFG
ncbi:hypothetical protein LOAG_06448 [Loa loa]|uniref:Uncharacterized protein n=1 Tax=Loa loa TaxID=7209 RepID=A0A1S0TXX4_LOALO|nr:hypothetical protein LOAG_06448 [Loa loa]EFO22038.1 hypothetical protein LOAG_06448 [Loa loa]